MSGARQHSFRRWARTRGFRIRWEDMRTRILSSRPRRTAGTRYPNINKVDTTFNGFVLSGWCYPVRLILHIMTSTSHGQRRISSQSSNSGQFLKAHILYADIAHAILCICNSSKSELFSGSCYQGSKSYKGILLIENIDSGKQSLTTYTI